MLFGRAQEEIDALEAAGIPCEVVPGVTAALAASATLGTSLTRRGIARSVAFLTPRVGDGERPNDWARTAASSDTAVIYMGAGQAETITAALLAHGVSPATPVVVVESASLPEERRFTLTLGELPGVADLGLAGPALILLGEVYGVAALASARASPDRGTSLTLGSPIGEAAAQ
jgi:uroporphyrin-III C-methyltransferase